MVNILLFLDLSSDLAQLVLHSLTVPHSYSWSSICPLAGCALYHLHPPRLKLSPCWWMTGSFLDVLSTINLRNPRSHHNHWLDAPRIIGTHCYALKLSFRPNNLTLSALYYVPATQTSYLRSSPPHSIRFIRHRTSNMQGNWPYRSSIGSIGPRLSTYSGNWPSCIKHHLHSPAVSSSRPQLILLAIIKSRFLGTCSERSFYYLACYDETVFKMITVYKVW